MPDAAQPLPIRPLTVGPITVDPPVILAPMAGITDRPFRVIAARMGAGLVVSEMVASREMVQAKRSVRGRATLGGGVEAVQLAGREARWMVEAARMIEARGAPLIDINMGCPAKQVTGGRSGAALMRDLDHALGLIEAVVGAVGVPVTLKCRLGWDDASRNAPELARRAEAAGVAMITVHGRTRAQFYRGEADWAAVHAVVEAVRIPVVVNGDVTSAGEARGALAASGAAGVMIGRGAQGAPWRPGTVGLALAGRAAPEPSRAAVLALASEHYEAMLVLHGRDLGVRVARKHLGWYMDRAGTDPVARRAVLTETCPALVLRRLPDALAAREAA